MPIEGDQLRHRAVIVSGFYARSSALFRQFLCYFLAVDLNFVSKRCAQVLVLSVVCCLSCKLRVRIILGIFYGIRLCLGCR